MDGIQPVGAMIQPPAPNQGLQTYADILGIKQQQQQLQTGQYLQQQQQAGAQYEQEVMKERQGFAQMMQTGKDDQGNPIIGDDGQPDPDKASAAVQRMFPLMGQEWSQKILTTHSDRLKLQDSARALTMNRRNDLGQILQAGINSNLSIPEISNQFHEYGKANPDARDAVDDATTLLNDHLAGIQDPKARNQGMADVASLLMAKAQRTAGMVDTGTTEQPIGVSAFGLAPEKEGAPIPKSDIISLANGQQARLNKDTGQYELITQAGGSGGKGGGKGPLTADTDPMAPHPNDPDWRKTNYGALVDKAGKDVASAQDADANYGTNLATADMIRNYSNKVDTTGPSATAWTHLLGSVGSRFGSQNVSDIQTLGSFLDLQSARLRDTMGLPPTNAGLATSKEMGTSIESQRDAIQAKTDYYQALTELNHRYRLGLDAAGNRGVNASPTAVNQFKSEFTKNADPIAMEIALADKRGDKVAIQRVLSQLSPEQKAQVTAHGRYLDQMLGK